MLVANINIAPNMGMESHDGKCQPGEFVCFSAVAKRCAPDAVRNPYTHDCILPPDMNALPTIEASKDWLEGLSPQDYIRWYMESLVNAIKDWETRGSIPEVDITKLTATARAEPAEDTVYWARRWFKGGDQDEDGVLSKDELRDLMWALNAPLT